MSISRFDGIASKASCAHISLSNLWLPVCLVLNSKLSGRRRKTTHWPRRSHFMLSAPNSCSTLSIGVAVTIFSLLKRSRASWASAHSSCSAIALLFLLLHVLSLLRVKLSIVAIIVVFVFFLVASQRRRLVDTSFQ